MFVWGEGDSGGHVLRETTIRGLRGLVCPSRISVKVCVCLLLQYLLQRCSRGGRLFVGGEGDSRGHVLRETTSRDLCGLVCPSRTSERGVKGDCVKEVGGEEGERVKERALGMLLFHNPRH
jgi:hypothetical protein